MMYSKRFWSIIERARTAARSWQEMYDPLLDILLTLEVSEILSWGQILYKYLRLSNTGELRAAAAVITGSLSADSFEQFLCWLIAQGKSVFLRAIQDADSLAELSYIQAFAAAEAEAAARFFTSDNMICEDPMYGELLSAAPAAYRIKSGDWHNYYHYINSRPLSDTVRSTIEREIQYAPEIAGSWCESAPWKISLAGLRAVLPNLCVLFDTS